MTSDPGILATGPTMNSRDGEKDICHREIDTAPGLIIPVCSIIIPIPPAVSSVSGRKSRLYALRRPRNSSVSGRESPSHAPFPRAVQWEFERAGAPARAPREYMYSYIYYIPIYSYL